MFVVPVETIYLFLGINCINLQEVEGVIKLTVYRGENVFKSILPNLLRFGDMAMNLVDLLCLCLFSTSHKNLLAPW